MNLVKGNLWDEIGKADLILFTANSTIKNKRLVMGKGAALEAKELFPNAPVWFAQLILMESTPRMYGVVTVKLRERAEGWWQLGAFQTKTDYSQFSSTRIIRNSVDRLLGIMPLGGRIALNFPGIGLGGLKREDVLPLLEVLPDNVFIYEL